MLAGVPLAKAAALLLDPSYVRWAQSELLGYMDLAQREIAQHRPESTKSRATKSLVAGAVQTLAATEQLLLDVEVNVATGKSITRADRKSLDRYNPSWQNATQSATIHNYIYEPQVDPRSFFVDPPAIASTDVRVVVSLYPTTLADANTALTVGDEWESALIDYTVARALAKDTEFADFKKAEQYYNSYANLVGIRGGTLAKAMGAAN